jgi:predicted PurR-regulated permease PerM
MAANRREARTFFFILFGLLALLTLVLIRPYISTIFVALIAVLLLRPLYDYLLHRPWVRGRARLATTITVFAFVLLILIPLVLLVVLVFNGLGAFFEWLAAVDMPSSLSDVTAQVQAFLNQIPPLRDVQISEEQLATAIKEVATWGLGLLSQVAVSLGTSLPNLFIEAIIFLVVIVSLLPAWDRLDRRVQELSPLEANVSQMYLHKAGVMVMSVLKGVFLLAILQGLIMGLFYWLASVPFAWFWAILSMAFAVLPVVGISFIALPIAIFFLLTGNILSAVLVLIGFYVFVNPLDIILRPRLVSQEAYLNFTLMLLALFGGIQLGGILGMIYGPVIMVLFLTSIDIYLRYYSGRAKE